MFFQIRQHDGQLLFELDAARLDSDQLRIFIRKEKSNCEILWQAAEGCCVAFLRFSGMVDWKFAGRCVEADTIYYFRSVLPLKKMNVVTESCGLELQGPEEWVIVCYHSRKSPIQNPNIAANRSETENLQLILQQMKAFPGTSPHLKHFLGHKAMELWLLLEELGCPARLSGDIITRMRYVQELLEGEGGESTTIAELARKVGMNQSYLKSYFRTYAGITVHAYLNQVRMQRAKRMLIESSRPVREIGFELGFRNDSNFIHFFRKLVGVTPAVFRKKWKEE